MNSAEDPFYEKLCFGLVVVFLLGVILVYGQTIILPILFSILLANTLLPVTNFLVRKKFNQPLSILLPLLFSVLLGASILYFLYSQVMNFMDDAAALEERLNAALTSFQAWFGETTSMSIRKQNQYIDDKVKDLTEHSPDLLRLTFISLKGMMMYLVLIPLYVFLILYYRTRIKVFLISFFRNSSKKKVADVLMESRSMAQRYLVGLSIETVLVFALNTIGFLILGIKYAIFLALLAALLNLLPYLGMLTANVLCMLITLVSSNEISNVVWVGIILAVVQFLDNNFGMPLIVGNTVRINALVTIIGVLVGGMLCGIPGMFLAIPGLAVLKVIFDKVPEMKPLGLLLGDDRTGKGKITILEAKPKSSTR